MATFKDKTGVEWNIHLTVGLIEDAKDGCGVDLNDIVSNPEQIADLLLKSPQKLVELFYVLCIEQIEERKYDARKFGRLFDRETLDRASDALIDAIVSFFPRSSAGKVIREQLPELLRRMDVRIEESTRAKLQQTLLKSATGSPESLG